MLMGSFIARRTTAIREPRGAASVDSFCLAHVSVSGSFSATIFCSQRSTRNAKAVYSELTQEKCLFRHLCRSLNIRCARFQALKLFLTAVRSCLWTTLTLPRTNLAVRSASSVNQAFVPGKSFTPPSSVIVYSVDYMMMHAPDSFF